HLRDMAANRYMGRHLSIPSVGSMPRSEQQSIYEEKKVKSLLAVPLISENKCIGAVYFDWVRKEHEVVDLEILLLRLFSEMFVNVKVRTSRERELRKLFGKTIEQNQRLKDFSYITSHNFRSSVANLMGLITILEDDRGNDEFFYMMKDTALKLNMAIDSINDLLNFEKDIASLEKTDCNLLEIISDILILNKKTAREKNISFELDVPKGLTIKVLPAYLQSVLLNLITNAMKYGITADKRNIYISAEKKEDVVLLTVADDGVGIDLERYGEKLFQLGSRFHAGMDSGHGMGLYITKQQIEAIGGRIEVESEVNKGTKFKVYLNA
ncbi:MAG: HAMP domain-containing sensor histidine kinase, partial [Bacteroidota bacterium]